VDAVNSRIQTKGRQQKDNA